MKPDYKFTLRCFGICMAALSLILSCCVTPGGLSGQAVRTLGVLAATLFLLIFESVPVCVSCLLSCAMLFAFGCVESISAAFSGFSNHILYFTTASFGISVAFQKSQLSKKLLGMLIRSPKLRVKSIIFLFMLCSAALSAMMSNVAAVVIFIPYAQMFLSYYQNEDDKKKTARCMMICLAVAALTGGMITPAGSSMNLICMDMLERYAQVRVRFIDWIIVGLPLALVMLVIEFAVITAVHRPAEPADGELGAYLDAVSQNKKLSTMDIYIGVLILGILLTWILSSWIPAINITVTAIAGLALMFVPGFAVMTWEEFSSAISWPTFFVAGSLISVAGAVTATGLCDWFTGLLFANMSASSEFALTAQVAAMTFVFMAVLPSAPAVITILSPILIQFAVAGGIDPVMLLMASALCVSNIYLFPLDAPLVVAYDKKAFGMFDMPKATIWIQLAMIVVVAVWIPFIFNIAF